MKRCSFVVIYQTKYTVIQESYNKIKTWYDGYVSEFSSEDPEIQFNIDLIKKHVSCVLKNVQELSASIDLDQSDLFLLQTGSILHDIGRFDQLLKTGACADNDELDHIQISLDVINKYGVLDGLDETDKQLVVDCVSLHDVSVLPKIKDEQSLRLINLFRDADKIDVLRIVSEYYTHKKLYPNKYLDMEFNDTPGFSKKIIKTILEERVVKREDVENLNDLKLSQMSLIFMINNKKSFKMISEKGYIKAIFETLSKNDHVIEMYRKVKIYMENQL